jgi:DNA polymerase-3 subunit beta
MIGKVIHSVGEAQESRPMLAGAFFRIMNGTFEIVSCDSFTLSICKKTCDIKDIGTVDSPVFEFIVPGHALNELMRILPEGEERMNVYLTRKHAIFRLDEITFFTRLIDEDYIDYTRIVPKEQTVFVTVNRERLLEGLERAGLVAEDKSQSNGRSYVCLNIEDDLLTLTSTSVSGKVYDEMKCTHEGEPIEIGFNCRYLINSIRAAEGEEIRMTLKSAKQSVTIEPTVPDEESSYFYMVLPVRMGS